MHEKFVHLRNYSSFSLAESTVKIDDMIDACKKYNMPALGITDNGNLFCSLEFSQKCIANGIKPIFGATIKFKDENIVVDQPNKIVLFAKNKLGYNNLIKLVSQVFTSPERNYLTIDDLKKYGHNIIATTAGFDGHLGHLLLAGLHKEAEIFLQELQDIFTDNLYIEIIRRGIDSEEEKEAQLIDLAYKYNIPLVATNEIFFIEPEMHESHDVLLCIANGKYQIEDNRPKSNPENYFKSVKSMVQLFSDIPEAITNTYIIAKRCSHIIEERQPILPKISENENEMLRHQASYGLKKRINYIIDASERAIYEERMAYELDVIIKMKFAGYFLIVSDFIKWSKAQNIPVGPGRGSGAGSVVAWSLYITDLDPIKFDLIFERFLNPERISMPDFDIDFCQFKRDEVIKYVQQKYGPERVAQIITFGKLQARAVIRDVGRVLQMPYGQVDKISKMVPFNQINPVTLNQAIEMEPMLKTARDNDESVARLLSIALRLEGLNRHASTHAAGIVIADRDLTELVPLYKDQKSGMLVVQYSMKYAEMAGLVKYDFLGLKTLTVIAQTCELIKKNYSNFDISNIDLSDCNTYALLSKGDSTGVFQFESAGMRAALRKLKPDSIKDLMALGALYRPGPMSNIPIYIACKHGKQKPDYLHPLLEDVLKETFGVIIYQEQVLQVAQKLAGYSLGSADLLRRAMGKKIKKEMDAQREMFINGCLNNNISKIQATKIFDLVAKFAGYGFNRAHAASYAMISYQTAFLKANYPLEFLTASFNIDINDTDKISLFVNDAKNQKIKILPPDINKSNSIFTIENSSIRYGLGGLKNISIQAMELLENERNQQGLFKDIFDFAIRLNAKVINKRQLDSLIKSGSFDSIHNNRHQLQNALDSITSYHSFAKKQQDANQISLFGKNKKIDTKPDLPNINDWDHITQLRYEFETFGFYLTGHPLDEYKDLFDNSKIKNFSYLKNDLADGYCRVSLAGVALQAKARVSPRGRFVSVLMSDHTGSFDVSIFDDNLLARSNDLVNSNLPLFMLADVRKDEGGVRLNLVDIQKLDDFLSDIIKEISVTLSNKQAIIDLKKKMNNFSPGQTKIKINIITTKQHFVEIELPNLYNIKRQEIGDIKRIKGIKKLNFI